MQPSPQHPKSTFVFMGNVLIGALVVLGMRAAYMNVVAMASVDPFAALRNAAQTDLGSSIGVRLADVDLKSYKAGRLVSSARVDRVDVSRDRQTFTLTGIRNGLYYADKKPYHYEAVQGYWHLLPRRLEISDGAHMWSNNLNVRTPSLTFSEPDNAVVAKQPIDGTVQDGTIHAQGLKLNTKTDDFSTGPIRYHGTLAMLQKETGDTDAPVTRVWDVSGDIYKKDKGIGFFYHGVANDGEILVKADLIEQDEKKDILTATGHVEYYSGKADLLADKATVYHKERRAVLIGHVTMLVKPKSDQDKPPAIETVPKFDRKKPEDVKAGDPEPASAQSATTALAQPSKPKPDGKAKPGAPTAESDQQKQLDDDLHSGKSLRKYPLMLVCDQIEYWYKKGSRHAHIIGNPQGRQELPEGRWRHVWSTTANYDAEKDELVLISTPGKIDLEMKNSKGEDLTGKDLTVSTKEDAEEDSYHGTKVKGHIVTNNEDDTRPIKGKKGDPKPPPFLLLG